MSNSKLGDVPFRVLLYNAIEELPIAFNYSLLKLREA